MYLASNQPGRAMVISSCRDKEDLPFLLGQMWVLSPDSLHSLQKRSIRSLVSEFGLYTYSLPSRLLRACGGGEEHLLWYGWVIFHCGVELSKLEISSVLVFHFMLDGSVID